MATTMNISLPETLREFVEEVVREGGYASASEYMRDLLRSAKAEKDLEQRLLAAIESSDLGEIGPGFFEELKAKAAARKR
jgi:antitoxin ParD1/3/4